MSETDLGGFLEAAGRSLADAQGGLAGEAAEVTTAMAISEADLEIKATVGRTPEGAVVVQPVSTSDVRAGAIAPGLVSTLRIRYVALAGEPALAAGPAPVRPKADVIEEVRRRPDVAALDKILDGLVVDAVYVPPTRRWLVTARDREERLVREVLIPDV